MRASTWSGGGEDSRDLMIDDGCSQNPFGAVASAFASADCD